MSTPITLDELVATAPLLTRTDRKYLLPTSQLALVDAADPDLRILTIDGLTTHAYASTYLDTADLAAYHLAARARPSRFKIRRRTYCDSGLSFLEVKTRSARGETVKDRLDLALATRGEHQRFAPLTVRMRTGHELGALTPVLEVTYDRTTYYLPASGSRVTVDTRLTWAALDATGAPTGDVLTLPGHAVVETKTTGRPCELDRLLWRAGHRPTRLSKYTCGLALTSDQPLTHNRWHRIVRDLHELATPTPTLTPRSL
ncbi:hypothetical protein C8046_13305 [Serinibacter arcticus]|uniref:VTC domain-containing protein n=1 Tax=Serinibacter arcticus TaxID=1655435 RepID=A0A2U1ZWW3_9MICO|nr:polyphosphate polymerase domain-containing protein [Serinibacter arcticus]PWD51487.1 hypothetical protein C8046_13305 [Serinibacter arcticus]